MQRHQTHPSRRQWPMSVQEYRNLPPSQKYRTSSKVEDCVENIKGIEDIHNQIRVNTRSCS